MTIQLRVIKDDPAAGHRSSTGPVEAPTLRVGEVAQQTGKTVRALHLYEELGLLEPGHRSKGGYRLYSADSVVRVRWIGKLQEMGFSLGDIQTMVKEWSQSGSATHAMSQVEDLFQQKLEDTRAQIQKLRSLEAELEASLNYLQTCPTCDPALLMNACTSCERHESTADAPELVAGFHAH